MKDLQLFDIAQILSEARSLCTWRGRRFLMFPCSETEKPSTPIDLLSMALLKKKLLKMIDKVITKD